MVHLNFTIRGQSALIFAETTSGRIIDGPDNIDSRSYTVRVFGGKKLGLAARCLVASDDAIYRPNDTSFKSIGMNMVLCEGHLDGRRAPSIAIMRAVFIREVVWQSPQCSRRIAVQAMTEGKRPQTYQRFRSNPGADLHPKARALYFRFLSV